MNLVPVSKFKQELGRRAHFKLLRFFVQDCGNDTRRKTTRWYLQQKLNLADD